MNEVIEFQHGRSKKCAESAALNSGHTVEKMKEERFGGTVSFTPLGIIVSTFEGENQHLLIISGDQSGRGEVLTVYAPVDSPMFVEHSICKGRSIQEVKDGVTRNVEKTLNPKIDAFLESIPPEAGGIIKGHERWGGIRF